MQSSKDNKNNKCVVLPFVKKEKKLDMDKVNTSLALLLAVDVQHNKNSIPEDYIAKLIEKSFDAKVLHMEYIDTDCPSETSQITIKSVNDNRTNPRL